MKEKGWAVHDLCTAMTVAGLSITYASVRAWVKGTSVPRADALGALATVFGVSVDHFFADVNEEGGVYGVQEQSDKCVFGSCPQVGAASDIEDPLVLPGAGPA